MEENIFVETQAQISKCQNSLNALRDKLLQIREFLITRALKEGWEREEIDARLSKIEEVASDKI